MDTASQRSTVGHPRRLSDCARRLLQPFNQAPQQQEWLCTPKRRCSCTQTHWMQKTKGSSVKKLLTSHSSESVSCRKPDGVRCIPISRGAVASGWHRRRTPPFAMKPLCFVPKMRTLLQHADGAYKQGAALACFPRPQSGYGERSKCTGTTDSLHCAGSAK